VLYEGRQIYFGPTTKAREFFTDMGFHCPDRQTTSDFLTSLTNPAERLVKPGFEKQVPKTPDEFAAAWKNSETYAQLQRDLDEYEKRYPIGGPTLEKFLASRRLQQSPHL
jgi:ATP-binding cassette subfamily G (WHITE) protein 2 (PDR)